MVDEKHVSQVLANDKRKYSYEVSNSININEHLRGSTYISLEKKHKYEKTFIAFRWNYFSHN